MKVSIEGGDRNEVFAELQKLSTEAMVDFNSETHLVLEIESKPEMKSAILVSMHFQCLVVHPKNFTKA